MGLGFESIWFTPSVLREKNLFLMVRPSQFLTVAKQVLIALQTHIKMVYRLWVKTDQRGTVAFFRDWVYRPIPNKKLQYLFGR